MPKSFSSHPYIDGCSDIIQHKMAFRTHICNLLQCQVKTLAEHIQDHRAGFADGSHMHNVCSANAVAIDPGLVPSISEVTTRMAKLGPKGLGESLIAGELFAAAPSQLARLYHPLYTKILNCLPPATFSGGRLLDLPKLGAAHTLASGYRDITVCNAESKPLLSFIRSSVSPHMQNSAHSGQYGGGCNHGFTAIAHLHARAYIYAVLTLLAPLLLILLMLVPHLHPCYGPLLSL